ncbi:MAG: outer membrane protein assembly factor BamA [Pseudomonadota bacterium]|nr:outer membrane protein assembly factor BamA [Pseudomonadota bacterium]
MTDKPFKSLILSLVFTLMVGSAWGESFIVDDIRIRGLKQITPGMIFNFLPIGIGDQLDEVNIRKAVRALFKTGYFEDVKLERDGNTLVVTLIERPTMAMINLVGNKAVKTEDLEKGLDEAGFSEGQVFNEGKLEKVIQELRRQYYANGKYGVEINYQLDPIGDDAVELTLEFTEGEAATIKQIKIIGNAVYSDEEIIESFKLTTGNWLSWFKKDNQYSRQKLQGDLETLRSYYQNYGYMNFTINSTQVSISPDKESVYVTINITEGDAYRISSVKLAGDLIVPPEEIYPVVFTRKGDIFSRNSMEGTSKAITELLGQEGYAFANVNPIPELDEENKTASLTYYVDPGQRVYVRRVNFFGNSKTRDEVLRREMRQMEGGWISTTKVERSKVRLQRTGFFETVEVANVEVPGTTDQVDVNFRVKEMPSGNLMVGAGFSQGGGLLFNTRVSQNNFLGSGKMLSFSFNNSEINKSFSLGYYNPYATIDGVARGFTLGYQEIDSGRRDVSRYDQENLSFGVRFGLPITEYNFFNTAFTWERQEIKTTASLLDIRILAFLLREGAEYDNFNWTTSIGRDTRNSRIFPDAGRLQMLSTEVALPVGDLKYWKVDYDHRYYFRLPFRKRWTLILKNKIGYGDSYGSTQELPFFRNFFAGGPRTVRGYGESSLGPEDFFGRALGGNILLTANAEVIVPVPLLEDVKSARVSVFYDAGNVFASDDSFALSELRMAVGVAGIWMSPMGLLSVSYSNPFNDQLGDEIEKFQFNFGTQF